MNDSQTEKPFQPESGEKKLKLERRPTYAEIDLKLLADNFQHLKSLFPAVKIMAVAKADAYGHGLTAISRELESLSVDYLGVGFLEEGIALREVGVKCPILVLGGVAGYQINYFLEYELELTASSHYITAEIDRRARRMNRRARIHLKIDTGMNRIGVNYRRAREFLEFAGGLSYVEVMSVYSHLSSAEDNPEFTNLQFKRLKEIQKISPKILGKKVPFHLLNTAGIMNFPVGSLDFIRPGLMIYGLVPDASFRKETKVEPVMSLKSEVVFLKRVPAGEGISYGLTHTTNRETTIATIPIGYGDGYPHRLSNCGEVLIGGKRYPIVGRVCMDQIMVDVGDDRIRIGQEVVLVGCQGGERITVEEICELTGAIPYEVTIGITERVPRIYLRE